MPVFKPVIWVKGTVLNPQHLQIQDRFLTDSLQFQMQALNFRPWGFQSLRIDQQALTSGTLAISEASGLFADGRSISPRPKRPHARAPSAIPLKLN